MSVYYVKGPGKAIGGVAAKNHHQAVFFALHYIDWCEGWSYEVTDEVTDEIKRFKAYEGMQLWSTYTNEQQELKK